MNLTSVAQCIKKQIMKKKKTICFVAGKSGGHLIPALTLAKKFSKQNKNTFVLLFTTKSILDKKIVSESNSINKNVYINLGNITYKNPLKLLRFAIHSIIAFFKSFFHLCKTRPQKVVSLGGYVSVPVCLAAFVLRIPIELFELNAVPGKAIAFLSPITTSINVCFEQTTSYFNPKKCQLAQYPIRFEEESCENIAPILHKHNLLPSKYTILILGGSQGSVAINNIMKMWMTKNRNILNQIQIIHQTGAYDSTNWHEFYKVLNVTAITFDFKNEIKDYYQAADIVICRSGAGTLFETIFFQNKCITIPLETNTTSHQIDNATAMANTYPQFVKTFRQKELEDNLDLLSNLLKPLIEQKISVIPKTDTLFQKQSNL